MSSINYFDRILSVYRQFVRAVNHLQSPLLLCIRLYWGWQFMQSGWGKLHHLAKVTQYFASLGIPAPGVNAHFIAGLEFIGGILLMLGVASRFVSLLMVCNMLTAYFLADNQALHSIFSDPGKFYGADPFTFLFASLLVLVFGPGKFAIDYWIARRRGSAVDAEDGTLR